MQTIYHTKKIIEIKKSNKKTIFHELTEAVLLEKENIFQVNVKNKDIISTESNLKYEVLQELLFILGISTDKFILLDGNNSNIATKEGFINRNILSLRNKISHGENIPVTLAEFLEVKEFIIIFIDTLKDYVLNISEQKLYML